MRIEDKDCTHEHAVDAKSYWVPKLKENATFWIDDVAESMKQHWRDHYLSGFWDTPIPTPQVITGLKPITLKAIVEAGALPDCLTFHDLFIISSFFWSI